MSLPRVPTPASTATPLSQLAETPSPNLGSALTCQDLPFDIPNPQIRALEGQKEGGEVKPDPSCPPSCAHLSRDSFPDILCVFLLKIIGDALIEGEKDRARDFFWCLFGIYGFDPQCPGTQVTLLSPAHGDCERAGDPGRGTPGKATIIPLKPLIWESWPVPGGIVVISHGKALVLLPTQTPAGRAGPAAGSAPHPGDNEHPVVTKPRQELHPHPTSPLTCCAIPGHSQPPSAHKSSPTAPVIPVLPTHALLPGLLRPNLPWQLLSRKKK